MSLTDKRREVSSKLDGNGYAVFFQAPSIIRTYPCLMCRLQNYTGDHADNLMYIKKYKLEIDLISTNIDDDITDLLIDKFGTCTTVNKHVSEEKYFTNYELILL